MANQPSKSSALLGGLAMVGLLAVLIGSFFVAGEEHYPGRFFIDRQAYWNGGTYYVKFTFLAVLLTLANIKPAGFMASTMLIFVPIVPMACAAFFFEALIAPRYVEGALESVRLTRNKNVVTAHVMVNRSEYQTAPALVQGWPQGTKVGLIVSGYFSTVQRIERRG